LYNLYFFPFPYFDHDAFMHYALHALYAPGSGVDLSEILGGGKNLGKIYFQTKIF